METDFAEYTSKGLKSIAKDLGIKSYSSLKKDELIQVLINSDTSEIDLDAYEKLVVEEPTEETPLIGAISPRRTIKRKKFGRR